MSGRNITVDRPQRGAAAVEFAIVASVFFMLLFGAMEMARLLWTWNAAAEATRLGARLAVVCDVNAAVIKTRMRQMLPALGNGNISVNYQPGGCNAQTCRSVSVSLAGYNHVPIIPFAPLSIPIQPFTTTLPREYMQSAGNPICN
ncbi:MAG: pilus assembly protein [Rhizobacter sp.]|nr:pilus assembly protein [Rhizobacter sp.]